MASFSTSNDSSPCPSPDYNDSPPYNHFPIKQVQRSIPFSGWLSMAPQVDNPISIAPVQNPRVFESKSSSSSPTSTSPTTNDNRQDFKPVGYSYKPPTPRKAVFSVGTDDDEEEDEMMEVENSVLGENNIVNQSRGDDRDLINTGEVLGSVSSVVQISYPGSQQPPTSLALLSVNGETGDESGNQRIVAPTSSNLLNRQASRRSFSDDSENSTTYDESPPEFDVRSSFAPMPKYGVGVGLTFQSLAPQTSDQLDNVSTTSTAGLHSNSTTEEKPNKKLKSSNIEVGPGGFIKINGGGGLFHGKRQYKGLTAHAVEQEMEEIGDETVMSHAPDPVYLASRLEMLRRNLEEEDKSPGGRRGGWVEWVGEFDNEEKADIEMIDSFNPQSNIEIRVNDEDLSSVEKKKKEEEEREEERRLKKLPASPAPTAASNPFPAGNAGSEISSTLPSNNSTFNKISAMKPIMERSFTSDSIASIVPPSPSKEAKMKALDERLEIRNIKRPDLEQVRELHCFHGDGDKHDAETYTTSAPFLLRLLVDEKHVCLVAVERPLPEPVALPNREDLSNSLSSLDQRIPQDLKPAPDSSPESLASPMSSHEDPKSQQVPELNLESQTLSPALAVNINSEPSSGTASANSVSEAFSSSSFGAFSATDSRFSFLRSNGHTQGISHYNPKSNRHQNLLGGLDGIKDGRLSGLARSEFTAATSTDDMGAPTTKSMATVRDPAEIQMNLVGPTHNEDIAPPRTIKVMGLPPPGGLRATSEAETVLAVASATIGLKENNEDMWANHSEENVKEFEAHILTLSIAPAERSQGLGKKMLESLMRECKRRASEASSRASSLNRSGGKNSNPLSSSSSSSFRQRNSSPPPPKMRTYLEVHPSNVKAMKLYEEVGFRQMRGNEGFKKNFFRGDNRIPMRERMKKGGQDAIVMEMFD